jgi:polyribonucleotide nucleotidyltransferase
VITALQLDTKIEGIPADVLASALDQAKDARMEILNVMNAAIAEPRDDVRDVAPKIISFEIPMDKIGEVIGPKGKVINAIQQETGAEVIVDDDGVMGSVSIAGTDRDAVYEAQRQINLILDPPTADVGGVYDGKVVNITNFGAFVNILPGRDGLLHISKIGGGKRIKRVEDVLDLGQEIEVKVEDIDPNGKISLVLTGEVQQNEDSNDDQENPKEETSTKKESGKPSSFEDEFEEILAEELGELGPEAIGGNQQRTRNRKGKGRGGRR